MHEYSLVGALVDRVERIAETRPGAQVKRLRVAVGEQAGVEIELLRVAYDTFRPGTVCAGAELVIDRVAAVWRCDRCDAAIAAGAPLRCPKCGRPARMVAGDDIVLERIEMEVPDV